MPFITQQALTLYRARTFCTAPGMRIASLDEAVSFIQQRGFIFFWPFKGFAFPNLWAAVAGDRPVADAHDDPGHVTWGWKDSLLGKHRVFYARILKHHNTFISLEMLPYFYALSPNYGSPDEDYLIDYEAGRMTSEARSVYEALLQEGQLDTIALRKAARMTSHSSDAAFNHALNELQFTFRILPIGVAEAGAWNYAFIYDLVPRHFTDIVEQAHPINEWEARRALLMQALQTLGASRQADLQRLFGWTAPLTEKAVQKLAESGKLVCDVEIENVKGGCLALPEMLP
jgi:hypothetical protein